ncbi:MAG: hypothetical protein AB8B69_16825 [Chitinophagales bacterium]
MKTSETLTNNALKMIQNTIKQSSVNSYSTAQPGGSLQNSLWNLYLDNQQKYQEKK